MLKPWKKKVFTSEPLTVNDAALLAAYMRRSAEETRKAHQILMNTLKHLEEGAGSLVHMANAHDALAEKIEAVANSAHAHEK